MTKWSGKAENIAGPPGRSWVHGEDTATAGDADQSLERRDIDLLHQLPSSFFPLVPPIDPTQHEAGSHRSLEKATCKERREVCWEGTRGEVEPGPSGERRHHEGSKAFLNRAGVVPREQIMKALGWSPKEFGFIQRALNSCWQLLGKECHDHIHVLGRQLD